jgi:general nucleoside transport system permease protein
MSPELLGSLLTVALAAAAPLAVAALGGLLTEAAGSLSVALEGCMLVGAFGAAVVGRATDSVSLGIGAAILAGMLLAALVGGAALALGADVFIAGLAANLLAPGAISIISQALFGTKGVVQAEVLGSYARHSPIFAIPVLGGALLGQEALFYFLVAAAVLLAGLYSKTVFGLRLRAAGEGSEVSKAAGIAAGRYRFAAHLVAGGSAGLAGAALASHVGAFVPGISAGRGWIALVAIYLGGKRPLGVILACLGLGLLVAASNAAQSLGAVSAELLQALPFVATALALVVWKRAERKA